MRARRGLGARSSWTALVALASCVVGSACTSILGVKDIVGADAGSSGSSGGGSGSGAASGSGSGTSSGGGTTSGASNSSGGPGGSGGDASSSGGSSGVGSSGGDASSGSGSGGSSSGDGGPDATSAGPPAPTNLPVVSGTCPTIMTMTVTDGGTTPQVLTFAGQTVDVWAGAPTASQHGPLVLWWHGTGEAATTVTNYFGQTQIDAVTAQGGVVASFSNSTTTGTTTGDNVWYTGDFATADEVVACALAQFPVDTRRIYTGGDSVGGIQAASLSYARSNYIAAAAAFSGGFTVLPAGLQDPTNVPAAMAIHGSESMDVVIVNFADASAKWEADVASKGGFTMDCNTGGGHVSGSPQVSPGMLQFFLDHPYKVSPQPYPPVPAVFPTYCVVGPRLGDGGVP